MSQILAIAMGGALGAMARFFSNQWMHTLWGRDFPYGTLFVNVVGSLCMGLLYVVIVEKLYLDPTWRALLMVGLLGAFTTFSTFSLETVQLLASGAMLKAMLNIIFNVLGCLLMTWLGLLIGRWLW